LFKYTSIQGDLQVLWAIKYTWKINKLNFQRSLNAGRPFLFVREWRMPPGGIDFVFEKLAHGVNSDLRNSKKML
jgi:hypothetical protein